MINNLIKHNKEDLHNFLSKKIFKKIFIIAGNNSFKLSGLDNFFLETLKEKKTKYFLKKNPYPEYEELLSLISEIKNFSPDLIVACGGGSVLDYGKIANVLENKESLDEKITNSEYKLKKNSGKLLAIPTTAGSGAEVTPNAVIYLDKKKYSIEGPELKPDYFFLISDFVKEANKKIKSSSGFDAIAQSIESLISRKSNDKSVVYATESLKISTKHFLNFVTNTNEENTTNMSYAANLSGEAISISKTTAPHAISYPFTSLFNISHGHAVSLTLIDFLEFNFNNLNRADCNFNLKKRFELLFDIVKAKNFNEFREFLMKIQKNANLENSFEKLKIDIKPSISKILSGINSQRLSNNPIKLDTEMVKKIILSKK